jgi:hypothetical protein
VARQRRAAGGAVDEEGERRGETTALYHVRIIEGAKDIHMVYYNKVHVQGANKKTYTYC